jgi:hypothetical protein
VLLILPHVTENRVLTILLRVDWNECSVGLSDNTKNSGNTLLTYTIAFTELIYSIGLFSKLLPPSMTIGFHIRTRSVLYSPVKSSLHSVIGDVPYVYGTTEFVTSTGF